MKTLDAPDAHHLEAACGWLGLGNLEEAEAELNGIRPACRRHPDVLQARWQIHARRQEWNRCLDLAKSLTQIAPERRFGWVHLAYSLHQLGRTAEARELLLYALDMFELSPTLAYYLSCYACSLGNLSESREWLTRAFELAVQPAERERLKDRAMNEPALAPLRDMIQHLV